VTVFWFNLPIGWSARRRGDLLVEQGRRLGVPGSTSPAALSISSA
jgi:hypothetical protein